MAYEQLKSAALPRLVGDVFSDFVQLVQAEVRLAKAEITSKLAVKAQSAIWFAAAGVMGLVTLFRRSHRQSGRAKLETPRLSRFAQASWRFWNHAT